MSGRLTSDLHEALQKLVTAETRLREKACGGKRYDAAVEHFDSCAAKVATEARLAGFDVGAT